MNSWSVRGWLVLPLVLMAATVQAAEVNGWLEWSRRVELSTPVSGVVKQLLVEAGQSVEQGQVLVRLDSRAAKAELQRAGAELTRIEALFAEAEREWERAQELYDRTLISAHDLEVARVDHSAAEAQLRAAQSAVTKARLEVEYSEVRAPFAGLVVAVHAELGQTVVTRLQSVPLVTLVVRDEVLAQAALDERQLSGIAPGDELVVRFAGQRYTGHVSHIGMEPVADGGESRYLLSVRFKPPADSVLRRGGSLILILP